jgi:3-hydroxyacyl-[acyl-carrier-protein] dehydratase
MKFALVDRIERFDTKSRISAVRGLSLSEEYLADHFPGNPVMPGVLMLEAMVQTGSWLLRAVKEFSFSVYTLKEASNVKYAQFLMPGNQLHLDVDLQGIDGEEAQFSGRGKIDQKPVVSARWVTRFYNLAQDDPRMARNDKIIIEEAKEKFRVLGGVECWKQMAINAS